MKLFQKTPLQQYRALRENFCGKFSEKNAWGIHQNSGERLCVYSQLVQFLKDSEGAECLEAQKGPEGSEVEKVKEVQ